MMGIIFGILLALLSVYFFYHALILATPNVSAASNAGYNIGKNLPWIGVGIGAYYLLKRRVNLDKGKIYGDQKWWCFNC